MSLRVGAKAIKISLIQTLPGKELEVVERLKKACKEHGVKKRCILKGFGAFDIVLIYEWKDYSSILTKAGPIEGVLKTSRSFAFNYSGKKNLFDAIDRATFTAFSLAKISGRRNHRATSVEEEVVKAVTSKNGPTKCFALGTLGWNEVLCVFTSNNIDQIIDSLMWSADAQFRGKINKTFSFFSINHREISRAQGENENEDFDFSKVDSLRTVINKNIYPTISVTCKPKFSDFICSYWSQKEYETYNAFGSHDVLIKPDKNITWAKLLADLLSFRQKRSDCIISTKTEINQQVKLRNVTPPRAEDPFCREVKYDYAYLEKHFVQKATLLASSLNTFKGLLNNPVTGDAFADMGRYPNHILGRGPLFEDVEERLNFATQTATLLKAGAELRLYGTHGTLSENVGEFTKLRGGIQRSLMAIEFVPRLALERATSGNVPWQGFVVSTSPQFANFNEVINVPDEALFDPSLWWAMYHESGHLIVNILDEFIDEDIDELRYFLEDKRDKRLWLTLLTELASEYIGFALGFYGDYDLFVRKLWEYINELSKKQNYLAPLSTYAVRSYFVEIFDKYFFGTKKDKVEYDIQDLDKVYKGLVQHIEKIEKILGKSMHPEIRKQVFEERHFIAAYNCTRFKELYPWFEKKLYEKVKRLKIRTKKDDLSKFNTDEVFDKISNGYYWSDKVTKPEAVLYKFLCIEKPRFSQKKALILTFSNINRIKLINDWGV